MRCCPPRPRVTGARYRLPCGGFTLFELLVVLVLIGLVTSFAVLGIQGQSPGERQREEARRLLARMELAREQAVLEARSLGIRVDADGYRFLEFADDQWRVLDEKGGFAPHALAEGLALTVEVEGEEVVLDTGEGNDDGGVADDEQPQVFFLPGGEVMPVFSIRLTSEQTLTEYRVHPGDERWLTLSRDDL